jgi:hypothetical protein
MNFERFKHSRLQIEVSQIIIHKADQPDVVVNFLDADGLAGENCAEVNLFAAQTDAAATRDHDGLVVKGVVDVGESASHELHSFIHHRTLLPRHRFLP